MCVAYTQGIPPETGGLNLTILTRRIKAPIEVDDGTHAATSCVEDPGALPR